MQTAKLTKQMIGFQKAAFDNTYTSMAIMQDYSVNIMDGFLRQFPWLSEENKKPIDDSLAFMKKAREDYKKMVDQGFERLEEMTASD